MRITPSIILEEIESRKRMAKEFQSITASFIGERITTEVITVLECRIYEAMEALSRGSYFQTPSSRPSFSFVDAGDGNVTVVLHNDAAVWLLAMLDVPHDKAKGTNINLK